MGSLQSIDVITDICIVPSDKEEDIPSNYYCLKETVDGHYAGVNAGGYFQFNKHNGPFISFKRAQHFISTDSLHNDEILPITKIAIRDVDQYIKENPQFSKDKDIND